MIDEKLFREIDEVSRRLDGLSRVVADLAYRAAGKRAPEVSCTQSTDVQQLKAEIAALALELYDFNGRRVVRFGQIETIVAKMRQLSAV